MGTTVTRREVLAAGAALAASPLATPAIAQGAPLRIGVITTLSGPGGYLGADARDALLLAAEMNDGRLGGVPVQFVVEDDALRPAQGKQIAERFLRNERIRLFTGVIFSNVLGAVVPDVLDANGIYVSCNAAPSNFAGRECHRNYFVISWQNDNLHRSAGALANIMGYRRVFILAPNYQAGRDALTGFKRLFQGTITNEVYTRLDQTDYARRNGADPRRAPDAVYHFHPGGLGIAFLRQYAQAGLLGTIPQVLPAPSMDVGTRGGGGRRGGRAWTSPATGTAISTTRKAVASSRPSAASTTASPPSTRSRPMTRRWPSAPRCAVRAARWTTPTPSAPPCCAPSSAPPAAISASAPTSTRSRTGTR